ncbi:hypothetical protein BDY24DRAFT_419520 [Mrakia frigida]|uniref:uncharacterized protein n=1 Tax=Mrakia frigida TaxID=29902 RepID=UPI003FCC26CE
MSTFRRPIPLVAVPSRRTSPSFPLPASSSSTSSLAQPFPLVPSHPVLGPPLLPELSPAYPDGLLNDDFAIPFHPLYKQLRSRWALDDGDPEVLSSRGNGVSLWSSSDPEAVFRDPVPDLSNVSDVPTFEQRFDPAEDEPWLDAPTSVPSLARDVPAVEDRLHRLQDLAHVSIQLSHSSLSTFSPTASELRLLASVPERFRVDPDEWESEADQGRGVRGSSQDTDRSDSGPDLDSEVEMDEPPPSLSLTPRLPSSTPFSSSAGVRA